MAENNLKPDPIQNTMMRVFNACENLLMNLYQRWSDEHEYENIDDYDVVLKPKVEGIPGVKFLKMNKKPFGFNFSALGLTFRVCLNSRKIWVNEVLKKG